MERREYLESSIVRHGEVENITTFMERGEKPNYETFLSYMNGEIDPPIDQETTSELIKKRVEAGELRKSDFDVIISAPALRAKQTAMGIKEITGSNAGIRTTDYLREVHIPMQTITSEFYASASDLSVVREKFLNSFFNGEKVDESVVDVFHRAQRFMEYLRKIKTLTSSKPLFVTHGIFARFLRLAIDNEDRELNEDQIQELVKQDFHQTPRPGTVGGIKLASTKEGTKIVGTI